MERTSTNEDAVEALYWKVHSLSKCLESDGRIDELDSPDAYVTLLDVLHLLTEWRR